MDDAQFLTDLAKHWPFLAWLVPIVLTMFYIVKFMAVAYDPVAKVMGRLGAHWQESAERKRERDRGEVGMLRDEVFSLGKKVDQLQQRDEIYWAYVMYDQEWHRVMESLAIDQSWPIAIHLSFLDFRSKWWTERRDRRNANADYEREF